jgi:hypothetical protein
LRKGLKSPAYATVGVAFGSVSVVNLPFPGSGIGHGHGHGNRSGEKGAAPPGRGFRRGSEEGGEMKRVVSVSLTWIYGRIGGFV